MTLISAKLLGAIAAVLTGVLVFLAAYSAEVKVSVNPADEAFGAVSALNSPMELQSGGTIFGGGKKLGVARRTLCDLVTPAATSTGTFSIAIQNLETYAFSVQAGYGATAGATTTLLGTVNLLGTGEGRSLTASTTGVFFPPNTHLVVNVTATTSVVDSGLNPTGGCMFLGSSY